MDSIHLPLVEIAAFSGTLASRVGGGSPLFIGFCNDFLLLFVLALVVALVVAGGRCGRVVLIGIVLIPVPMVLIR